MIGLIAGALSANAQAPTGKPDPAAAAAAEACERAARQELAGKDLHPVEVTFNAATVQRDLSNDSQIVLRGAGTARPLPCNSAWLALCCRKLRVELSKLISETRGQRCFSASTALDSHAASDSSLRSGSAGARAGAAFAAGGVESRITRPTASEVRRSTLQL